MTGVTSRRLESLVMFVTGHAITAVTKSCLTCCIIAMMNRNAVTDFAYPVGSSMHISIVSVISGRVSGHIAVRCLAGDITLARIWSRCSHYDTLDVVTTWLVTGLADELTVFSAGKTPSSVTAPFGRTGIYRVMQQRITHVCCYCYIRRRSMSRRANTNRRISACTVSSSGLRGYGQSRVSFDTRVQVQC